jgi:hypothetical protein
MNCCNFGQKKACLIFCKVLTFPPPPIENNNKVAACLRHQAAVCAPDDPQHTPMLAKTLVESVNFVPALLFYSSKG